jgi:hypothetical protein
MAAKGTRVTHLRKKKDHGNSDRHAMPTAHMPDGSTQDTGLYLRTRTSHGPTRQHRRPNKLEVGHAQRTCVKKRTTMTATEMPMTAGWMPPPPCWSMPCGSCCWQLFSYGSYFVNHNPQLPRGTSKVKVSQRLRRLGVRALARRRLRRWAPRRSGCRPSAGE